jgi:CRP/FNR family cyclic AMP-dependent transcriptional regulator
MENSATDKGNQEDRRAEGRSNGGRRASDRRETPLKEFSENSLVFRERETGQEAFIIKSGQVEIFRTVTEGGVSREVPITVLNSGTMFGEMALIDNELRMASARAYGGDVTVYVISQDLFDSMLEPVNPFVRKLLNILVDHVRANSDETHSVKS